MEEGTVDMGEKLKMSFKNAHSVLRYLSRQMAASHLCLRPGAVAGGSAEESSDFIFLFISNRLYSPQGEGGGGGMKLEAGGTNYDSLHG